MCTARLPECEGSVGTETPVNGRESGKLTSETRWGRNVVSRILVSGKGTQEAGGYRIWWEGEKHHLLCTTTRWSDGWLSQFYCMVSSKLPDMQQGNIVTVIWEVLCWLKHSEAAWVCERNSMKTFSLSVPFPVSLTPVPQISHHRHSPHHLIICGWIFTRLSNKACTWLTVEEIDIIFFCFSSLSQRGNVALGVINTVAALQAAAFLDY